MLSVPMAWSSGNVLLSEKGTSQELDVNRLRYNPYTSYNPYTAYNPYTSYTSYSSATAHINRIAGGKTLVRREHFGASVCPPSGSPFKINHEGLDLLRSLPHSDNSSLNIGSSRNDETSSRDSNNEFLRKCIELGWSDAPNNYMEVGDSYVAEGALSAPYSVFLYPNMYCNLEKICQKCYVTYNDLKYLDDTLTPEAISPLLDTMDRIGVFSLIILGGEPLSYKYIFELLQLLQSHLCIASLSTNGLLVNEENASLLSEYLDRIQISLDGIGSSSAEALKGRGTFQPTLNAIELLTKKDIGVIVSYVLTKHNSSTAGITEFVEKMAVLGVDHISFIQYYPFGNTPLEEIGLDYESNQRIDSVIQALQQKHPSLKLSFENSFSFMNDNPPAQNAELGDTSTLGCDCGRTRVSIYPNGDVIPCDFTANHSEFVVGNIFSDSFDRIWRYSPGLKDFRSQKHLVEPCSSCSYNLVCGGGCKSTSFQRFGDPNAPDPRCPLVNHELV